MISSTGRKRTKKLTKKAEEKKLVTITKEDETEVFSREECKNECKAAHGMKNHMIKKDKQRSAPLY